MQTKYYEKSKTLYMRTDMCAELSKILEIVGWRSYTV